MTRERVNPAARFGKWQQERELAALVASLRVRHVDCVLHAGMDQALEVILGWLGESEMGEGSASEGASRSHYEEGRRWFERNRTAEALRCFERAYAEDSSNARLRSYYGLCLGIVERRFDKAMELCQSAAKQEFFNPDLYLNIARLNLAFGFKSEGLRYLRRGRMIDPANAGIEAAMRELGVRVAPVLGFLPRRHLLNRWLGGARHFLSRRWTGSEQRRSAA